MTFGSVFSGIGGFERGLELAGHRCVFQVERDKNCQAVLEKHWPRMLRIADVRDFNGRSIAVRPDWIVGGFPCQDLSVAGRRAGLAGARSGLFFEFMRIVGEFSPSGVLIENVPGLLSSGERRDMGIIVGRLVELGYGVAWRVLDAQWFGVPQQRRRVFIVGCAGADVRRAAEILFERESLPWDSPPSREAGARVAASITSGSAIGSGVSKPGRRREDDTNLAYALTNHHGRNQHEGTYVAHSLTSEGHDASEDGTGRGVPLVAQTLTAGIAKGAGNNDGRKGGPRNLIPFTFDERNVTSAENRTSVRRDVVNAITTEQNHASARACAKVRLGAGVRRLTPKECCRLQGLPDDWLDGLGLSDSAKYRMLGNAVAVPVIEWIGRRLMEAAGLR